MREGEASGYPKASLLLRAGARLVDVAIAWAVYRTAGPAGVVIALLYILFADGMLQGQSPGKKLFGVKVVFVPTRSGARHRDSVLRNAPFGLIIILSMMPELGPRAFLAGLAVIGGIEALLCVRDPEGLRLGDGCVVELDVSIDGDFVIVLGGGDAAEGVPLEGRVDVERHDEDAGVGEGP